MRSSELEATLDVLWREIDASAGVVSVETVHRLKAALGTTGISDTAATLQEWLGLLRRNVNQVNVVATGLGWLGSGIRSVEQTMLSLVSEASSEIQVTAYSLTGGSSRVTEALRNAASSGIRVVIVINKFLEQRVPAQTLLKGLAVHHPANVAVYDFNEKSTEGLHAKVMVVDRRAAVVGSANLTFHGMTVSHELGLLVRGPAASSVATAIDSLLRSGQVTRVL